MKRLCYFPAILLAPALCMAQTTLLSPTGQGGFEPGATITLNGWTVVNDASNQWFAGAAAVNAGARGAYISNDAGGTNTYLTGVARVSHFYRDIAIPATDDAVTITFNWKNTGEIGWDYIRVYWSPTTVVPTAGVLPPAADAISGQLAGPAAWQTFSGSASCQAGTTRRLIITWRNDGSLGTQPPGAIDNIGVVSYALGITNDLPCSATALPLGVPFVGDNRCTGSAGEPGAATCWTAGTLNTVWYTAVCPASGQLRVRTNFVTGPAPLYNTQIALYSGTCAALAQVGCNDNAPACGLATYVNSDLTVAALTPGNTYFIRVDGANAFTGQFSIIVVDGTVPLPPIPGQDCTQPTLICSAITYVGDPGYQGIGNVCDFGSGGNCTTGERGAAWYQINIAAAGNLMFTIRPNDYSGVCLAETDYDFVLWKVVGAGSTNCANIQATAGGGAAACNYDAAGVTGCYTGGNAPAPYAGACYNPAFQPPVVVAPGEVYYLVVQNFSNSTSGFFVDFSNSTPGSINYAAPTSLTWTGGAQSTGWTINNNWGGCAFPTCTIDAIVTVASSFQPVLTAGTYYVKSLTINPAASLTINSGVVLEVCGDFTNNGFLNCDPNSTVRFVGLVAQNMYGSFTGGNSFGHLDVNKPVGTLTFNSNVSVDGTFMVNQGPIFLNSNTITINSSATGAVTRANGYVVSENTANLGKITWAIGTTVGAHTFPFGTALGVYIPFTLNLSAGDMGSVTLSTYPTSAICTPWPVTPTPVTNLNSTTSLLPDNRLATAKRFWQIDKTGPSGTANLTFSFPTAENPSAPYNGAADQRAQRWQASTSTWQLPTAGQSSSVLAGVCTVQTPGISTFSPWAVASVISPLPVELVTFTGKPYTMSSNLLEWTTESETDNDFFTIQSSENGTSFSNIGSVDAAGTSSTRNDYSFIDESPFPGLTYYRLMQTDFDLRQTWSTVISVDRIKGPGVFNLVPNPTVNGQFSVVLDPTLVNKEVLVVVYDVKGEESFSKVIINGSAGSSILVTDPSHNLAPGIYVVTASSADKLYMQKLVVID